MDELRELAEGLRQAAQRADHRRLVVLHGTPASVAKAARVALDAAREPGEELVLVGPTPLDGLEAEHVPLDRVRELMGATHPLVVLDAREGLDPNALGRAVGAVDGGGLLVLLTPPLEEWPTTPGRFAKTLAVPPFTVEDVGSRFTARLVDTLRAHEGVAIVDADANTIEDEGDAAETPPAPRSSPRVPGERAFPRLAYEAALTREQAEAVRALETLLEDEAAVVLEADRGRGKSSAAGLAAGALVAQGATVLITAPAPENAREVFARARELLDALDVPFEAEQDGIEIDPNPIPDPDPDPDTGGRLLYRTPEQALEEAEDADALLVDEAAGLPVHRLAALLDADPPSAFATTVHGYEGAGRGFSVRFKDRLDAHTGPVERLRLAEPIRYAPGDPLERWAFHALLLDARPPVDDLVEKARPDTVAYRALDPDALLADEHLLREAFGLLVLAHYRTTPRDLARLLDAPNLAARALTHEGHVVAVALVAREGGLDEDTCARLYQGEGIRGHMIPDVLASQLRDEHAPAPTGQRVLRIAVHPSARRRGLGSRLLEAIHEEDEAFAPDWFGTAFGATPGLIGFWHANGYRTVHLGTSRNPASGEHSAILLNPQTEAGRALHERSTRWLAERIASVLADGLDALDPDVARAALAASDIHEHLELELSERAWRHLAACIHGPGLFDANPRPVAELALVHLAEQRVDVPDDHERLIVAKALQARDWETIVDELGYVSKRMAMKTLARALEPVFEAYAPEAAMEDAGRYRG